MAEERSEFRSVALRFFTIIFVLNMTALLYRATPIFVDYLFTFEPVYFAWFLVSMFTVIMISAGICSMLLIGVFILESLGWHKNEAEVKED